MGDAVRVGIFGGTFDPPHVGHLIVGGEVLEAASLDRLLWMPAATPPHKIGRQTTSPALRAEMVRAAIRGDSRFEFSDLELERGGVSYTVDTLEGLAAANPRWSLALIVGADQLGAFESWKQPGRILELAEVVAVARDGNVPRLRVAGRDAPVTVAEVPRVDVSSTQIRARVAEGRSVRHMVPDRVLSIIEREHLYRG